MSFFLSASWVYPVSSPPLQNGVIAVDSDGTIIEILSAAAALHRNLKDIRVYEGILVPGLINTHCHLELSHLFAKIPEHTGLPGFVQSVIQQRGASEEDVAAAMLAADQQMYENGIVAVGDISNQSVSRKVKLQSKLYYHTFVEAMGFNPSRAVEIIEKAAAIKNAFAPLKATVVPHAPYSVSPELFAEINRVSGMEGESISIHNQETMAEDAFFRDKTGHFLQLYEFLGLDISFFAASGKSSLQNYLPGLSTAAKTLLVHNTFSNVTDIRFGMDIHPRLFWCLCPGANLYIEDSLPDVHALEEEGALITLGTDSLASNHQLSILAEMRILQEQKGVSFDNVLRWATLNGAEFLGINAQYGSLEAGKRPGINLIAYAEGGQLGAATTIERLV